MKRTILTAIMIAVSPALSAEGDVSLVVAKSGSPAIDQLVLGLVSRRPAPLPMGGFLPGGAEDRMLNASGRCATVEVEAAFQKLKAFAPRDYANLLKHAYDDRYSFSVIAPHASPTMSGWMNHSVGQAIDRIFSNEMEWVGGYKTREAPGGNGGPPPQFSDFIDARGGDEKWVASVAALTRVQIDLQFLDWCVRLETDRGFIDDEQRKWVLERYEAKKREVQAAPAKRELPSK
jgi:hypothetical protein